MRAIDVLNPGETALVLFTRGELFIHRSDGTGETGNWRIDPTRISDRVIIYRRTQGGDGAEVFISHHAGWRPSTEEGRWVIALTKISLLGTTHLDWGRFADAGTNPVRYITRPAK